jgi:hypothetical protein
MRKLFVPIFVVVLLIVLPAISWYYLKSGLSWRRDAIGELSDYGSVEALQIPLVDARDVDLQEFENHLLVFFRVDCSSFDDDVVTIEAIREQFIKRSDVEIFIFGDCIANYNPEKSKNEILKKIDCTIQEAACSMLENSFFHSEKVNNVAFIDGNLKIRNYYRSSDQLDMKRLVEHMAMMLPDVRRKLGKENRNK